MNNLMRTFMVAALLNARAAMAQTVAPAVTPAAPVTTSKQATTGMAEARFAAPIGHRQPRTQDVGAGEAAVIERVEDESSALDRKLRICRGC